MSTLAQTIILKNIAVAEIKISVKKRESGRTLFDIEGGGEVSMPNKMLPKDIHQAEVLVVDVVKEDQFVARRKNIAKALLDEILNAHEKTSQKDNQKA